MRHAIIILTIILTIILYLCYNKSDAQGKFGCAPPLKNKQRLTFSYDCAYLFQDITPAIKSAIENDSLLHYTRHHSAPRINAKNIKAIDKALSCGIWTYDKTPIRKKLYNPCTTVLPDTWSNLKNNHPLDTTLQFEKIRHAAYGYSFARPPAFIEQIDTVGQVDSIVFYSSVKDARLIYFVQGKIRRLDTSENFLRSYFKKLETGEHPRLKNCKIINSHLYAETLWLNDRGSFCALGHIDNREFVWVTKLSEIPISGDLTYKTMLFIYPNQRHDYYLPIGLKLADDFR